MIVNLSFTIAGRFQLDLERAMEDPWWEQYTRGLDLDNKEQFARAIYNYVSAYLRNEDLLSNAPFTCGPADVYHIQTEVKDGGRESATAESSNV